MTIDIVSDRDEVIKAIKVELKRRSGKAWSVTGGRGTSWGWIRIDAPPARKTIRHRLKAGAVADIPANYEAYDSGQPGGSMTPADREELGKLLGLDRPAWDDGESIPAGHDYRREYLQRAKGEPVTANGKPYWD